MDVVLPLLSTVVTLIFAVLVLVQFFSRHKAYQLVWGIALIIFAIGTGSELAAGIGGWSLLPYQLYWLFGAFFTAAYLGQGTMYLLTPRWIANLTMAILLAGSAIAAYLVFTAPIDVNDFALINAGQKPLNEALAKDIRMLTIPFSSYGTVALIGGAIYSFVFFWRKKAMGGRALGNILIAVGTMVIAAGGTLAKIGSPEYHFLAQLAGVSFIFAGFLKTR